MIEPSALQVMSSQRGSDSLVGHVAGALADGTQGSSEQSKRCEAARTVVSALNDETAIQVLINANLLPSVLQIGQGQRSSPQHPASYISDDGSVNGFLSRVMAEDNWCIPRALGLALFGSELFGSAIVAFMIVTGLKEESTIYDVQQDSLGLSLIHI